MSTESRYRYTGEPLENLNKWATLAARVPEQAVIDDALAANVATLSDLQSRLYAQKETGVIVILQGMDTAGKDGLIRHVLSGLNPAGTSVVSFKQPTNRQLSHDFLWRVNRELPERGEIRIFNRSQYEDVLISRVHPEMLLTQHIPGVTTLADVGDAFFDRRYRDLRHFETYLRHQGFVTIKFFLHLSRDEQTRRFERRIEIPSKNWKFSPSDMQERAFWNDYQVAYTKMLTNTATKKDPWYIIPADDKGVARLIVSNILVKRLQDLRPTYPQVTPETQAQLRQTLAKLKNNEL